MSGTDIGTPAQAKRIVAGVEARALERFPDRPLKEALKLHFESARDAEKSYRAALAYLADHEGAALRKRLRSESRDEFYRGDGAALYEKHVRQTTCDKRLLQSEVEKLFDDVACAALTHFVKRATGRDDDVTALNVVYANAPQLYEERHAAIRAAVAGRPEGEVIEHVAKAMDIAKRIAHIADAVVKGAATTDPARAIREAVQPSRGGSW